MYQFILKTTRDSITSNLEDIDSLLDKLFLLVDPIKICSALSNKTGPYATVVEAVGKFGSILKIQQTSTKIRRCTQLATKVLHYVTRIWMNHLSSDGWRGIQNSY